VVVVLESGSCIALDDKRLRGLLQAWYPGEAGGLAVAEALFGKFSPSGRLPVTFYESLDQVPAFDSYKMDRRTYRYLHVRPRYGFGYGLSYARFSYSAPKVTALREVSVTVKNTARRESDEVVQVYAAREKARWPEPTRRLVAFGRVHLNAGETRQIRLPISQDALAMADQNGKLKILPGVYTISIGGGQPGLEPATSGPCVKSLVALEH